MRVLVTGGRMFGEVARDCPPADRPRERARADGEQKLLNFELNRLREEHGPLTVIEGGDKSNPRGADRLARDWVVRRRCMATGDLGISEPADWPRWGGAAGPIRNQAMLDKHAPQIVLAFPGGAGTADMVDRAKRAGIPVKEVLSK